MKNIVAIILARGGSKGIPNKNIIDFCGKPLIAWTIEQLKEVEEISSIWVSSDSPTIRDISRSYGALTIERPSHLADDEASSESGWLHALELIEKQTGPVDIVVAPQVTSPLREPKDIEQGIEVFIAQGCDSLFSCSMAEDLLFWQQDQNGSLKSMNYNYQNRGRRQDRPKQFIENGSFYIFKPETLRRYNNRLGGKIGIFQMEFWKMFEIDSLEDLRICQALMKEFFLNS